GFNIGTGIRKWQISSISIPAGNGEAYAGFMASEQGTIVLSVYYHVYSQGNIISTYSYFIGYHSSDGAESWHRQISNSVAQAQIDTTLFTGETNGIIALQGADGSTLWQNTGIGATTDLVAATS